MQDRDGAAVGAGANRIEPCASGEPACAGLGSALRVTSTGSTGAADPAILFEPPAPAVVQLVVRVRVPAGGQGHRVRAYRNSREDALFTLTAQPGELVERTVSAALISEDRFGVALEPLAAGGVVGVELFVIDPRASLPAACTLALSFNDPTLTGSVISDGCGTRHFTYLDGATPVAAITVRAPYAGLGQALYLESQLHATGRGALLGGARTIQLWLHQTSTPIRRACSCRTATVRSRRALRHWAPPTPAKDAA